MNLVDSSGWLEYFADGTNTDFFSRAIEATSELVVPTVSLYEVFKRVMQQSGESAAKKAIVSMQQGRIIELTSSIAFGAARLSLEYRLPIADSIIFASAKEHGATLWTQDSDFDGVPGVQYKAKVAG